VRAPARAQARRAPPRGPARPGMLVPVCCFGCNKRVGRYWLPFCARVQKGDDPGKVLDSYAIARPCCRRMLLTSVELNSLCVEHEMVESKMAKIEVERTDMSTRTVSAD